MVMQLFLIILCWPVTMIKRNSSVFEILNPLKKSCLIFLAGSVPKSDHHSSFVAEVKRSLPPEKSVEFFQTISCYKKTDDYDKLAADVAALFKDNFSLLVSKLHSHVLYFQYLHFWPFLQ